MSTNIFQPLHLLVHRVTSNTIIHTQHVCKHHFTLCYNQRFSLVTLGLSLKTPRGQERWSWSWGLEKNVLVLILVVIKSLEIFKTLINGNTNLIITYMFNSKMLIFTCISMIYYKANACVQHFQSVTTFNAVMLWQPSNPGFNEAINE